MVQANGMSDLVLTHLDVYDELDSFEACIGYKLDGKELSSFPAAINILEKVEPVMKSFEGWKMDLGGCRDYNDLPEKRRNILHL
jgi:adenylosuccinate synthase